MADCRKIALSILTKIEHDKAYSNLVLNSFLPENIDDRDKSFIFTLVKTVLERKLTIDYNLSLYLKQPLKKLKPQVLYVLRLGCVQILFSRKIPDSAAINESVNLIKKSGCGFASGLVNAVLRNISKNGLCLPEKNNIIEYLSIKYSYSTYITELLFNYYGEEITEKIMASALDNRILYGRLNNLISIDYNKYNRYLTEILPNCITLNDINTLKNNTDFQNGEFHIQDLSSQLCCLAVNPKEGETVIDICAAPGGKSLTMAEMMNNKGKIISCDIHPHKIKLVDEAAKRLHIDIIEPTLNDGTVYNDSFPLADKVLCDVPCSGFGVCSKKPEIKYKNKEDVEELYDIQMKILNTSSNYVKSKGKLIYSTCTLNPKENIDNCRKFLDKHSEFKIIPILENVEYFRTENTVTVLPYIYNSDGFFVAVFEKE